MSMSMENQIAERLMRENERWGGSLKHKEVIDEDVEFYTLKAVESRIITSPELELFADRMVELSGKGNRGRKSLKQAILCLINACFEAIHNQGGDRMVGVLWSTSTSSPPNSRYKGATVSPRNKGPAANLLRQEGYIELFKGSRDSRSFVPGKLSLVLPKEKMSGLFNRVVSSNDFTVTELEGASKEVVILKGADNKLVDYKDDDFTRHQREVLLSITRINQSATWTYDNNGVTHTITPSSFVLKRQFKNYSFESYGRMHCDAQALRKNYRESLKINGQPTCTLDFKSMSATLAYVYAGWQELDPYTLEGDAYEIEGYTREQVKLAFQICMNTESKERALRTIYTRMSVRDSERLLWALEKKHWLIKDFFYQKLWMEKLIIIESNIMFSVLIYCSVLEIPVLPIHDGIVCRADDRDNIYAAMLYEFQRRCGGVRPTITSTDEDKRPLPWIETPLDDRASA